MSLSTTRTHRSQSSEKSNSGNRRREKRTPFFNPNQGFFKPSGNIQRKCDECKKEEAVQRQPMEEEEEELQMQRQPDPMKTTSLSSGIQRTGGNSREVLDESVARVIETRRGRGQPLDTDVRSQMEGFFSRGLSDVRIHTDRAAHDLNEVVRARAFTTGNDIFFKDGTYKPGSSSGQELLAHELTHVVQQRTGTSGLKSGEISHPSDSAEKQARSVGKAARHSTGIVSDSVACQKEEGPDKSPIIGLRKLHTLQDNSTGRTDSVARNQHSLRISRDDNEKAYKQKKIYFNTHERDTTVIPKTETNWGSHVVFDDSYFKDLLDSGPVLWPRQEHGVGFMELTESFVDWRDTLYLNDQFIPKVEAKVRWEQRSGEERLSNIAGTLDYNPDGGGGMQIDVLYSYGGYVEEGGKKKGQHNILLNFTYDSQMTQSTGIEFGGEFGGKSGKVSAKASSSVSVSKSALRFSREIAFESYSYD